MKTLSFILIIALALSCQMTSKYEAQIDSIEKNKELMSQLATIHLVEPSMGAHFPKDMRSPFISWEENNGKIQKWLVQFWLEDSMLESTFVDKTEWEVPAKVWESLKENNKGISKQLKVKIWGILNDKIASQTYVGFFISPEPVEYPVLFRSVPLPFPTDKNINRISWLLGDFSSYKFPKKIISNRSSCLNCHSASADGRFLGLELNRARNDDRSLFLFGELSKNTVFTNKNVFSWNKDLKNVSEKGKFGSSVSTFSPDGRFVMSSIRSNNFFIDYPHGYENFSYFWPLNGILGYRSTSNEDDVIKTLPGADDENYIHITPEWAPNGKFIVFGRAKVRPELLRAFSMDEKNAELVNTYLGMDKKYGIKFDLYKIDFNNGKGGKAVPIKGASVNGRSNYYPKISPDGRWIVFTQSAYGFANRPDSDLYIVPVEGGEARKLECNGPTLDSWHSWSPNGKWLVYATKALGPYTNLAITGINPEGKSTPPLYLTKWRENDKVINLPIFVKRKADDLESIEIEADQ